MSGDVLPFIFLSPVSLGPGRKKEGRARDGRADRRVRARRDKREARGGGRGGRGGRSGSLEKGLSEQASLSARAPRRCGNNSQPMAQSPCLSPTLPSSASSEDDQNEINQGARDNMLSANLLGFVGRNNGSTRRDLAFSAARQQLPKAIESALSEIFDRYTSSNRGRAMVLKLAALDTEIDHDGNPRYKSGHRGDENSTLRRTGAGSNFLISESFYLDVSGTHRARAWTYIRSLYTDFGKKVESIQKDEFLAHYAELYRAGNKPVRAALFLHGYTDGLSARKLCLTKQSLGLRAVAHVCACLSAHGCHVRLLDGPG